MMVLQLANAKSIISEYRKINKKMNIGLLTLPLHVNYGGILQAYALKTILERFGFRVFLITHKESTTFKSLLKEVGVRIYNIVGVLSHRYSQRVILKKENEDLNIFCDKHFKDTISDEAISKHKIQLEAIVVGSDQVWRSWDSTALGYYYLDFAIHLNIKRIAYAVSFGTNKWTVSKEIAGKISSLVKRFDRVSVREHDGISLCKNNFGVQASHVLDPTLLLFKNDYLKLLDNSLFNNKQMSTYILDEDDFKKSVIKVIERESGKMFYSLYDEPDKTNDIRKVQKRTSIETWLTRFMTSQFLITDSFHGTAFAINFNIPFIVLANAERGNSRLQSLLDIFELQERLVVDIKDAVSVFEKPISWERVNSIRDEQVKSSLGFIKDSLSLH